MITLQFEHEGRDYEITVPYHISVITFNDFLEFEIHDVKLINRMHPDQENEGKLEDCSQHLIEAVSQVVRGDLGVIPFMTEDDKWDHLNDFKVLQIGDELSMFKLYRHIRSMFALHKPKQHPGQEFRVEYKGEEYLLTGKRVLRIINEVYYTVGEFVEIMEWRRKYTKEKEEKGDPQGNIEFKLGLTEVALLLRKEDEPLPYRMREREKFIFERITHFQEIPCDVVFDLRFFLIRILTDFLKSPTSYPFSEEFPSLRQKGKTISKPGQKPKGGQRNRGKSNGT